MHRLYYSPSACSLAVHIVLAEIGETHRFLRDQRACVCGTGIVNSSIGSSNPFRW